MVEYVLPACSTGSRCEVYFGEIWKKLDEQIDSISIKLISSSC